MSEHSTPEERTELPTTRRWADLRKRGQIFVSTEVAQVAGLLTGFIVLRYLWEWFFVEMQDVFRKTFVLINRTEEVFTLQGLQSGFTGLLIMLGPPVIILVLCVATVASLAVMLQTNWNVKEKKIEFRWTFLNPISGFQRIFGAHGWVNTGKSIAKLACIAPVAYFAIAELMPQMIQLLRQPLPMTLTVTGEGLGMLFWRIGFLLILFSIFDYFYGRYRWFRMNKMTKDEVKDDRKAEEGDEETKRAIQRKGLTRIVQRIRSTVPKADVVVTNPTHYAVALQYDRDSMVAPRVIAKGQGFLALRIRGIAQESGVPVLERKELARALYASTEVGSEIPRDLFRAVAEVLAYVYRIKNRVIPGAEGR